jgi:hypothetical protein
VAARLALYPTPTCPFGRDIVEIDIPFAAIVNDNVAYFTCAGWPESVTLNVSCAALADAVGVPLRTPEDDKLSPGSELPFQE